MSCYGDGCVLVGWDLILGLDVCLIDVLEVDSVQLCSVIGNAPYGGILFGRWRWKMISGCGNVDYKLVRFVCCMIECWMWGYVGFQD